MIFDSRRAFLAALGSGCAFVPSRSEARPSSNRRWSNNGAYGQLRSRVLDLFEAVPGTTSLKIWSPATRSGRELLVEHNPSERLFIGSAMKAFVLCERLRQLDSPDIVRKLSENQLKLDASVWTADSQTFNPPKLSGLVTERAAMEAMIMHSDNTATDMELLQAGRSNVQKFLDSAGLTSSAVPDTTRIFLGYLLGVADYKNFTWEQLISTPDDAPFVNPALNDVETLASSCNDLVSFYSRALHGRFFKNSETLSEFRRILTLGDVIGRLPFPLGVSAFAKGGSIDVPGYHALCVPGAMFFADRWVYFSTIINWNAPAANDPETVATFIGVLREVLQLVKDRLSEEN